MTPFTRSNTARVPQKHPPTKTAVAFPAATASEASTFAGGIGSFAAPTAPSTKIENANTRPKTSLAAIERLLATSIDKTISESKRFGDLCSLEFRRGVG